MAVTKLIINYDNQFIFSGSEDGSFAFVAIVDKDLRKKDPIAAVQLTNEEMVSRLERESLLDDIAALKREFNQEMAKKNFDLSVKQKEKQMLIDEL